MKLLMVMNVPYTRAHGGANRSNRALLEGLAARGHDVAVVTPALATPSPVPYDAWRRGLEERGIELAAIAEGERFRLGGVEVRAVRDAGKIRSSLLAAAHELAPDWILAASEDPSQNLLAAALEARPGRVAYMALTPQLFPFGPESLYPGEERTDLVRRCALVCCLSHTIAGYISEHAGVPAEVYHPPHFGTGPYPHRHDFDHGAVLLMNACAVKGISIFLALARALPHIPFAALPGYATTAEDHRALAELPNVSLWANEDDLDALLGRTRALLMPTLWQESFGLAAVDAMLRGVPVLASDHGALPEAKLGVDYLLPVTPITRYRDELADNQLPVPVVPEQDAEPWRRALAGLLADQALYQRLSAASREAALRFVSGLSLEPFERLLHGRPAPRRPAATATADATPPADELTAEQRALLILRMRKRAAARAGGTPGDALTPVPRDAPLPLSFAQQRLFFLDRLYPGSALYNTPSALRLGGRLDPRALGAALAALLARHEALRTTFTVRDGEPVQSIAPTAAIGLPAVDLGALAAHDREAAAGELLRRGAVRPFDLGTGPLLRAALLRLAGDDHILLLSLHHIVTDGWSAGILIRDLAALYGAFVEGSTDPLPRLELHYADYAAWQRRTLTGDALARQVAHWRAVLEGAPALLELPTDRPRPAVQGHRGASAGFRLPAALAPRLEALSRERGATLFMVLLAAFTALLHRLSGERDLVVGTPVAHRELPAVEGMVGFFVNTLALRTDLSGDPTFATLLDRVKETTLDALAHQALPFEKLVEELHPERSRSHSPIFQVLFALQNAPGAEPRMPGLELTQLTVHSGTAKFDLNLEVAHTAEGLEGSLEYDVELFEAETIAVLLRAWQTLLADCVDHPERRLSRLRLLETRAESAVLAAINPAPEPAATTSVVDLFRRQAQRTPEAAAVRCGDELLTYGELDRRSRRLAGALIAAGAGCDQAVGLSVERSVDLAVGVVGILAAGAAYVPLDPSYPAERLGFMVADTAARVVVCHPHLAAGLAASGARVIALDGASAGAEPPATPPAILPASLAFVMYTSGSTGRPKGVEMSHRALANLILWHLDKLPGAVPTLGFASLGFDASFHELFATLAAGGCLHLLAEPARRDLPALPRFLVRHRIEKAILPVVVLHHLGEQCAAGDVAPQLALREVICTGEQLKITPPVAALLRRLPEASLHNDYGPTESHVITSLRVSDREDLWAPAPPIGRPIRNARVYLLDPHLTLLPPGLPGELYLAGDALARGYRARPRLTAERFLPDPYSPSPGGRMYRSGDLARERGGNLHYLQRLDEQVKIRGLRVEPGEVEAVLRGYPGLADCLVVCREDRPGDRRLVAYLIAGGEVPSTSDLRRHLEASLPDYMVPAAFVALDRFPLTANGKVDRDALPAPQPERPRLVDDWQPPRTEVESRLGAIWGEVLGQAKVGMHDNFFALGGHSLLMIQVASRIHAELGVEIPIQSFFDGPTVEQQAVAVTELLAAVDDESGLEALLDRIDSLDESEVRTLLEDAPPAPAEPTAASPVWQEGRSEALRQTLLRAAAAPPPPAPITAFGFPSSNRPRQLEAALRSYLGNVGRHGHQLDFVVASDPRDGAADREYRELLARLAAEHAQSLWYAGSGEKEAFAAEMSRQGGPPPEVVRFALFDVEGTGRAYGTNRNALLLHLAGELFLSADDDTLAELYRPPAAGPGVDLCTEEGVSEIRVAADRVTARDLAHAADADLVGLHTGVLGASVAEVVSHHAAAGRLGLARAHPGLLNGLEHGEGRVLASYHGWLGDSGWASPRDAQFLTGDSWSWLTRSEEDYRQALESREQVRYVDRLTLSRSGEFFVIGGGFDGRQVLPPFMPVQRREDYLFGLTLQRARDDSFLAHLPTMVTHGSPDRRFSLGQEAVDFAAVLEAAIGTFDGGDEGGSRLVALGRHLEAVGSLPAAGFREWLDAELRRRLAESVAEWEARAAACPPERAFWARDMRRTTELLRRSLNGGETLLPRRMGRARSPEETQALVQRLLAGYGRLLGHWPQMLARAGELKRRGIRLARPVTP